MTKTQSVIAERARHHAALEQLARSINPQNTATGLQIWRKLNRLEQQASAATTAYCNGTITDHQLETTCAYVEKAVVKIFGGLPPSFHINLDPRGYALKLASNDNGTVAATPFALHQDWGRNQILAPTIE